MPAPLAVITAVTLVCVVTRPTSTGLPGPADAPTIEIATSLEARPLEPGVWLIVHREPWPSNALLVEARDGTLVLCDTPATARAARDLLAWIREQFGDQHLIVINGHFHPDCLAGNAVFEDAGAETWGSDRTAELLAQRGERVRRDTASPLALRRPELADQVRNDEWRAPTNLFHLNEGHAFDLGEPVRVIFPGPAHAPDNVVTWFPERGVLFGGCAVLSGPRPGYTTDADLDRWPDAIREMRALDPRLVVPGHGDRTDPGLLDHTLAILG